MRTHVLLSAITLLVGVTAGCMGRVGEPEQLPGVRGGGGPGATGNGPGGDGNGPGGTSTPVGLPPNPIDNTQPPGDPNAAGPMPLRRLNNLEYNNTVRDLLGDKTRPADKFPLDQEEGFLYRRAGQVASLDADRIRQAAESLAGAANATSLAPCSGDETACAKSFVQTFGLKAYRRPLTNDEVTNLMALYQDGRTKVMLDYAGAIQLLVEGMLQSPGFIYRWELGPNQAVKDATGMIQLGGYEMASRLSYFLWRTMPDQTLFDAAANNKLASDADIEAQISRMLNDDRARQSVAEFFEEWLSLNLVAERPKDAATYPEWNADLKAAMDAESRGFVDNAVFDTDGRFETLLTANYSFVNAPLAAIYDVSASGAAAQKTDLDPSQRSGILTQAGFLTLTGATDGSNPVKRGRKVYERVLCGVLPPPPPNVPPPKPASAGGTTRQRFSVHDQQACAKGCHTVMDPIGYGFEHYDGIGRYRTKDNGLPVDSASKLTLDGKEQAFADAVELTKMLAASTDAKGCFVTQWARYAWSRAETDADMASLQSAAAAFTSGNESVKELILGVAKSRSFRYRSPADGETL
jgi:Protein of unknown function (DUF1592)/Protein of unknown function (DUF1588)/Protein of unknown function (DUF1595)/Protein of unknown function (DUF1585)/Protein of unknown function (DUF1587)